MIGWRGIVETEGFLVSEESSWIMAKTATMLPLPRPQRPLESGADDRPAESLHRMFLRLFERLSREVYYVSTLVMWRIGGSYRRSIKVQNVNATPL